MLEKTKKTFLNGIIYSNPVFCLVLGTCPTLAMTQNLKQAVIMGIATTFVLMFSNLIISLLRNFIQEKVRIPCYIVVISTFVVIVELFMKKFIPDLYSVMKLFISLIVVNCIILARAESFASKNNPYYSFVDGISMGIGFTLAISIIALVREIITFGALWGVKLFGDNFPAMQSSSAITATGFIIFACVMATFNFIKDKAKK